MLVNKYFLESKKTGLSIILGYNEEGGVCYYDASSLTPELAKNFLNSFPASEAQLDIFKRKFPLISVTMAKVDLSFKTAYDTYGYKVGKKAIQEKLWDKMTETEKLEFHKSINPYNSYLDRTKIAKAYLETYLRNKYYENDFRYL